jgi:hypothetical protein
MLLISGKLQVMGSWEFRFQKTMQRAIQLSHTCVRTLSKDDSFEISNSAA